MSHKTEAFAAMAKTIIENLKKRNMEGYYFENSSECVKAILDSIPSGSVISWGGSETIKETGLMEAVHNGSYELIDRTTAKNPEEARQIYARTVLADYYLMSSNAVTIGPHLGGPGLAVFKQLPDHGPGGAQSLHTFRNHVKTS